MKLQIVSSLSATLFGFWVYFLTAAPTVVGGDSAELTLVVQNLGVAHPPGYPLYTLAGWALSHLPFSWLGQPQGLVSHFAWKLNLFSALCSALAGGLVCLGVQRWTRNIWAGLFSAGLYFFAPLVWQYSVVAEVFALNNLFIGGLLVLLVELYLYQNAKIAPLLAFWLGLGLSNHHTFIFYAFPSLLFCLWSLKKNNFYLLIFCFALGFLPYLYLPWAASRAPLTTWGDQTSVSGFLTHFFRREYGTFSLMSEDLGQRWGGLRRFGFYFSDLPKQLGLLGVVFFTWVSVLIAGKKDVLFRWRIQREEQVLAKFLFWLSTGYLVLFSAISNFDMKSPLHLYIYSRFWQQVLVVWIFLMGIGATWLSARLSKLKKRAFSLICISAVIGQGVTHYSEMDQSKNTVFREFSVFVLNHLPQNALLLTSGDHITHSLQYFQDNEKIRPDVKMIDHVYLQKPWYSKVILRRIPDLKFPGAYLDPTGHAGYLLNDFLLANQIDQTTHNTLPIFIVNGLRIEDDSYHKSFGIWPIGLTDQMIPNTQEPSISSYIEANEEQFKSYTSSGLDAYAIGSWEHEFFRLYWRNRYAYSAHLLNLGLHGTATDQGTALAHARSVMESVEPILERTKPELFKESSTLYKNLGICLEQLKENEKATQAYSNYLSKISSDSPEFSQILERVKKLNGTN